MCTMPEFFAIELCEQRPANDFCTLQITSNGLPIHRFYFDIIHKVQNSVRSRSCTLTILTPKMHSSVIQFYVHNLVDNSTSMTEIVSDSNGIECVTFGAITCSIAANRVSQECNRFIFTRVANVSQFRFTWFKLMIQCRQLLFHCRLPWHVAIWKPAWKLRSPGVTNTSKPTGNVSKSIARFETHSVS